MTVPHGCRAGCGPDYGIDSATAGGVWGALCGLLASVARQGWRPRLGVAAAIVTLMLFTVFEPK